VSVSTGRRLKAGDFCVLSIENQESASTDAQNTPDEVSFAYALQTQPLVVMLA